MNLRTASAIFIWRKSFAVGMVMLLASLGLGGCTNTSTGSVNPNVNLGELKVFYVVKFAPDGRGINQLIANELAARGYQASTGPQMNVPEGVDAIVTYSDRWRWDVTMFMKGIDITILDARNNTVIASGSAARSSFTRQSPNVIIAEVLGKIFSRGY